MVNRILASLLEGVFPQHCILCGLRSHHTLPLCADCAADLQPNQYGCTRCALPLPQTGPEITQAQCGNCLRDPPPFDRVIAPWLYDELMAYLIHRWKFQREQRLTPLLASLWLRRRDDIGDIDLMLPVPLHWRRLWWRGFNQSLLLCKALRGTNRALASIPLATKTLSRSRATAPQSGMNARERAGNLRNAFTVHKPCDNLRVAVIDDVFTTGATAVALATALRAAGASRVEIWCLARTPSPGN